MQKKLYRYWLKLYCYIAYIKSIKPLKNNNKAIISIFFDYEGEWAHKSQKRNSEIGIDYILSVLKKYNINATFNIVGKLMINNNYIDKIISQGHEISSHTYSHTSVLNYTKSQIIDDLNKSKQVKKTIKINGFRSPQSKWNISVLDGLLESNILWNAEDDNIKTPYIIRKNKNNKLWRIPVTIDDWNAEGAGYSANELLENWKNVLDNTIINNGYASFGFHPWVLAKKEERLIAFEEFVKYIVNIDNIEILTFGDVRSLCESKIVK